MLVHLCDLYMAPSVIPFINQVLQLVKFFYAQSYSKQKLSRKSAYVRSLEEEGRSWLPDQVNPYKEKEKCGTLCGGVGVGFGSGNAAWGKPDVGVCSWGGD